jgi:hypothetical protein
MYRSYLSDYGLTAAGPGSNHGNRIEGPMRSTKRDLASSIRLAFDMGYEAALNRAPQMELKIVRKATVDRLVIELMAIQSMVVTAFANEMKVNWHGLLGNPDDFRTAQHMSSQDIMAQPASYVLPSKN